MGTKQEVESNAPIVCPFCGYRDGDLYMISYHIENSHTEDSPFTVKQQQKQQQYGDRTYTGYYYDSNYRSDGDDDGAELGTYVSCPEEGCGELVLLAHLQNHMDMHGAERMAMIDMRGSALAPPPILTPASTSASASESGSTSLKTSSSSSSSKSSSKSPFSTSFLRLLSSSLSSSSKSSTKHSRVDKYRKNHHHHHHHKSESSTPSKSFTSHSSSPHHKKPTKSELGPYAREKHMPIQLYEQLLRGPRIIVQNRIGVDGKLVRIETPANESPDLVPLIRYLLEQDSTVGKAWLCHPAVRHICKQLPREGGFCGYRNIQMLITYIMSTYQRGRHPYTGVVPTIIKIQHDIEKGWDSGININGRVETGGILGTRKYIGTSEAITYFTVQGIRCQPIHVGKLPGLEASDGLFNFVEQWFEAGRPAGNNERILQTSRPPIYIQHAGHSMTIIGLEKRTNGSYNLLVFDPSFATSPAMIDLAGAKKIKSSKIKNLESLLAVYRRNQRYLGRYNEFELLMLQ